MNDLIIKLDQLSADFFVYMITEKSEQDKHIDIMEVWDEYDKINQAIKALKEIRDKE